MALGNLKSENNSLRVTPLAFKKDFNFGDFDPENSYFSEDDE